MTYQRDPDCICTPAPCPGRRCPVHAPLITPQPTSPFGPYLMSDAQWELYQEHLQFEKTSDYAEQCREQARVHINDGY